MLALTDHEYTIDEPTWPWTDWDRDADRRTLSVAADGYAELQWAAEGSVVGRGPEFDDGETDVSCVRARIVSEGDSETGTQPFLLG